MSRISKPLTRNPATIHTVAVVGVSWSLLCCCVYASQPTPCPSAEESKSFALEYQRKGRSSGHWELQPQTAGSTDKVNTCHEHGNCDWGEFGHVSVTIRQLDDGEFSHINISRVTPSWRNKTLRYVVENETNKTTKPAECKMDNFHKPDSAQCAALKVGDNGIRVTCRTRRVYPKLRCQLKQFGSPSVEENLISDGFEYTNILQPSGHYNSSCSVDILNLRPGQYQYFGALIPAVEYKMYVRNLSVAVMPTVPIEIQALRPDVFILPHEAVHVCIHTQKTTTFLCKAHKFESSPKFEWLLWDLATNATNSLPHVGAATNLTDGTGYMSTYRTPVGRDHVGKHIVCLASYSNITAQHHIPVNVTVIPQPRALFTEFNGRPLGSTLVLNSTQRLTVGCRSDADDKLFLLQVHCQRNNQMFLSRYSFDNKLIFAITVWSFDSTHCTCNVEDSCYNVTTTLYIKVILSQNITTNTTKALLKNDTDEYLILYVFIGVVVSIFLVTIICSMACFYRRRRSLEQNRRYSDDHLYEIVS